MNFTVDRITIDEYRLWLLHKHYAKRVPPIKQAFGLFNNKTIIGVCTFGGGCNEHTNSMLGFPMLELNRLVVNEDLPKNSLSYFVGRCLFLLKKPVILVSYSDMSKNHHGYIYQATNWLYVGMIPPRAEFFKDGIQYHTRSLFSKYGTMKKEVLLEKGYTEKKSKPKYKYFYILASKTEKKNILKNFPYKILPYPKGDNTRYDASYKPIVQARMF